MKRELYESIDKNWESFSLTELAEGTIIWDTIQAIAQGNAPKYILKGVDFNAEEFDYNWPKSHDYHQTAQSVVNAFDVTKAKFIVDFFEAYKGISLPGIVENKSWKNPKGWKSVYEVNGNVKWAKKHLTTAKRQYNASKKFVELF